MRIIQTVEESIQAGYDLDRSMRSLRIEGFADPADRCCKFDSVNPRKPLLSSSRGSP